MTQRLYLFDLFFLLPDPEMEPEDLLDPLFEAGCDDAGIGWGRTPGALTASFSRRERDAATAIATALRDVGAAIPGAVLEDAGPDLVGISDIARLADCSRQNVRKHLEAHPDLPPGAAGDLRVSHWHLAEIGPWLVSRTPLRIPRKTLEVAREAMRLNHEITRRRLDALPPLPEETAPEAEAKPRRAAGG